MSRMGTLYIEGNSIFHRLDGSVKLLLFIVWTIITFMFLDLRVFGFLAILGIILLYISKIPFKVIKPILWVMIVFSIINSIFILLITPTYGTELIGTNTKVLNIGYDSINLETLFYVFTLSLKYATLLPITLIFIFTTHPSKFASSLNKIGVPYKIAYAINIAFRYIPDVQAEFKNIVNSQEARGISFKKGEATLKERMKNGVSIAVPLVTSSLRRIEVVSNAMDLRGFGKNKKRTWYNSSELGKLDYIIAIITVLVLVATIYLKNKLLKGFWYPF